MQAFIIFGCITIIIIYTASLRHKERMTLISKGIQPYPKLEKLPGVKSPKSLFFGLIAVALGLGFVISSVFIQMNFDRGLMTAGLIFLFGGAAILGYWKLTEQDRKLARRIHEERINSLIHTQKDV